MTFTIATATPRLDTRVSRGSAPRPRRGRKATRSKATPANPARRDPPMQAAGDGERERQSDPQRGVREEAVDPELGAGERIGEIGAQGEHRAVREVDDA